MSNILLINDYPCFGKVALSAMNPILSYQSHHVYNLPTAIVSNTLDYGKFEILETTDYMKNAFDVYQQLNFSFDCICTGFIVSLTQSQWIASVLKDSEAFKMVDPIMGDDGHLYNGVTQETVEAMKNLCREADLIVPNFTEASFLTGLYKETKVVQLSEIQEMIKALRFMGAKSVVITSVNLETEGRHCVVGYDDSTATTFVLDYDYLPVRVPGTGDMFSSVLLGCLLNEESLEKSVQTAMDFVYQVIASHENLEDTYRGVLVERFLSLLPKRDAHE